MQLQVTEAWKTRMERRRVAGFSPAGDDCDFGWIKRLDPRRISRPPLLSDSSLKTHLLKTSFFFFLLSFGTTCHT